MAPVFCRILKSKKKTGDNVLCRVGSSWGEKISSHAHKTGSWWLLEVLFKISDTPSFLCGSPGVGAAVT